MHPDIRVRHSVPIRWAAPVFSGTATVYQAVVIGAENFGNQERHLPAHNPLAPAGTGWCRILRINRPGGHHDCRTRRRISRRPGLAGHFY